jgi:hypothetical protein
MAMHHLHLLLTDLEWNALRGHHRDGLSMTDSRYIGLLLGQEVARVAKQDGKLRELRQALVDSRTGNAQG